MHLNLSKLRRKYRLSLFSAARCTLHVMQSYCKSVVAVIDVMKPGFFVADTWAAIASVAVSYVDGQMRVDNRPFYARTVTSRYYMMDIVIDAIRDTGLIRLPACRAQSFLATAIEKSSSE